MTANELLEKILATLNHHDKALFSYEEVTAWPPAVLDCFITSGLLECASPTHTTICDGCEQHCIMPVEVLPALNNRPAQAFIGCDQRDDIGRIPVDLDSLKQWQTTTQSLAFFLAKALAMPTSLVTKKDSTHWELGIFKGYQHQRPLVLEMGETIQLLIAGHSILLIECLLIDEHQISVNKNKLNRLVDGERCINSI